MSKNKWEGKAFYQVLGVAETASIEEIKSQYRWLARKFHPDQNGNDERAVKSFLAITEAYEVLSVPELRAEYDTFLHGKTQDSPSSSGHAPRAEGQQQPQNSAKPPYRGQSRESTKPPPRSEPTRPKQQSADKTRQATPSPDPHTFAEKTPSFATEGRGAGFWLSLVSLAVLIGLPIIFVVIAITDGGSATSPTTTQGATPSSTSSSYTDSMTIAACTAFWERDWSNTNDPAQAASDSGFLKGWATGLEPSSRIYVGFDTLSAYLSAYASNPTDGAYSRLYTGWVYVDGLCSDFYPE